jgi:hypothetical protein
MTVNIPGFMEAVSFEDVNFGNMIAMFAKGGGDLLEVPDPGAAFPIVSTSPDRVDIVYHPGVELFSDDAGTKPFPGAKGIVLETTTSPGGVMKTIFPTTRTHFQKGRKVAAKWNVQKVWPAAWYRDPDTGEIKLAWLSSAEFVGRHNDPEATIITNRLK